MSAYGVKILNGYDAFAMKLYSKSGQGEGNVFAWQIRFGNIKIP
jgi:hypothetical protein